MMTDEMRWDWLAAFSKSWSYCVLLRLFLCVYLCIRGFRRTSGFGVCPDGCRIYQAHVESQWSLSNSKQKSSISVQTIALYFVYLLQGISERYVQQCKANFLDVRKSACKVQAQRMPTNKFRQESKMSFRFDTYAQKTCPSENAK